MSAVPLISIITPAYNCARYIEQCLQSVAEQEAVTSGAVRIEHIVVDGASTDGTVEVLTRYGAAHPHLRWISEPDDGEADALNKAVRLARGDIIGWLNADDYYLPGALSVAAREINPARERHLVYGRVNILNAQGGLHACPHPLREVTLPRLLRWFCGLDLYQPAMFFSRELATDVGEWTAKYSYAIDYEWWLRACAKGYSFHYADAILAEARLFRDDGKTATPDLVKARDWLAVTRPYVDQLTPVEQNAYWRDYRRYYLRSFYPRAAISPLRQKLAIGTRLRRLKGGR